MSRKRRDRRRNTKLRAARERLLSPSGSGRPMSTQELAEAVNAWLWHTYEQKDNLTYRYIAALERGDIHWPGKRRREAFRAVLGAETDTDLGFYIDCPPRFGPMLAVPGSHVAAEGVDAYPAAWSEPVEEAAVRRRELLGLGGLAVAGAGDVLCEVAAALTPYEPASSYACVDAPPRTADVAAAVRRAKRDYQASRYTNVLAVLPSLLTSARLACLTASSDEMPTMWALAADAYQVAGSVMLKLGDHSLAAFAAERSMDAATRSESPVAVAASARLVTHCLMSGGHARRAQELATRAAQRLAEHMPKLSTDGVSAYGALLLRGAVAAASHEDRTGAGRLIDEAGAAARRLGRDGNSYWTAFGPTNVAQHRVHIAMLLGDAGTAVDLAGRINLDKITLVERKASLFIDTASALAQWGKHERALHALCQAEQAAPEEVRTCRAARQTVADLADRGPQTVRRHAREFAEHIGVPT